MLYANENAYDAIITTACAENNVPVALVKAIIGVESNFIPTAQNLTGTDLARGGSYGLMQVSLQTADGLGYSGAPAGLLDPATNIGLGVTFLADVLDEAAGDPATAASLYNGGHALGGGTFTNQAYVEQVMSNYAYYEAQGASAAPSGSATTGGLVVALVLAVVVWGAGRAAGAW